MWSIAVLFTVLLWISISYLNIYHPFITYQYLSSIPLSYHLSFISYASITCQSSSKYLSSIYHLSRMCCHLFILYHLCVIYLLSLLSMYSIIYYLSVTTYHLFIYRLQSVYPSIHTLISQSFLAEVWRPQVRPLPFQTSSDGQLAVECELETEETPHR